MKVVGSIDFVHDEDSIFKRTCVKIQSLSKTIMYGRLKPVFSKVQLVEQTLALHGKDLRPSCKSAPGTLQSFSERIAYLSGFHMSFPLLEPCLLQTPLHACAILPSGTNELLWINVSPALC